MNASMIVITGPTASGKTRRAVDVARALGGEIVSADSRQLYRGMDIGTGKDMEEYGDVPVHLVDIAPAGMRLNLFNYLTLARKAIGEIKSRRRIPVVCGGTGMYVEALINNLALPEVPENRQLRESLKDKSLSELTGMLAAMKTLHNTTDVDTVKRAIRAIEIATYYKEHPEVAEQGCTPRRDDSVLVIGVEVDRETRRRRITRRLHDRMAAGLVEESARLVDAGLLPADLIYYGLEYKFTGMYLSGELTLAEMTSQLETAIHQFAKRQMTWFRGMDRRGIHINWIAGDLTTEAFVAEVLRLC